MSFLSLSCFASKQTLRPQERCIVIPIVPKTTSALFEWVALSGPITCIYSNDGGLALTASSTNRLWLSVLFDNLLALNANEAKPMPLSGTRAFDLRALMGAHKLLRPSLLKSAYEDAVVVEEKIFFEQASLWWKALAEAIFNGSAFVRQNASDERTQISFAVLQGDAFDVLVTKDFASGKFSRETLIEKIELRQKSDATAVDQNHLTQGTARAFLMRSAVSAVEELVALRAAVPEVASGCAPGLESLFESADLSLFAERCSEFIEFMALLDTLSFLRSFLSPIGRREEDPQNRRGAAYAIFLKETIRRLQKRSLKSRT